MEGRVQETLLANMFCTNCGKKLDQGTRFCTGCGHTTTHKSGVEVSTAISANTKRILIGSAIGILIILGIAYAYSLGSSNAEQVSNELIVSTSTQVAATSTDAAKTAKVERAVEIPKIGNLAYAEPSRVPTNSGAYSVAEIVSGWQNRVAQVSCTNADGDEMSGTATLVSFPQGLMAVSNDHVIDDGSGYWPSVCVVGVYGLGGRVVSYDSSRFTSFRNYGLDYAQVNLENPDYSSDDGTFDIVANNYMPICSSSEVGIGDEIVILGYPWNGSQSSVTASRGIVSGYDDDYYVTDAKIEHGNSGGAAILMKKNCWLGIPTAALVGGVESYGRILKGEIVLE